MDKTAMSLAKAFSSAVETTSGDGLVTVKSGLALCEEAREVRRRWPTRPLNLLRARDTAKLHQTIDIHKSVPTSQKKIFI